MRILVGLVVLILAVGYVFLRAPGPIRRVPNSLPAAANGSEIKKFKKQLLSTLKTLPGGRVSISVPENICQTYLEFEMTLQMEGLTINGEPLLLKQMKTCQDVDRNKSEIVWQFDLNKAPADSMPLESWTIKEIKLVAQDGSQILMTGYEIIYVQGAPLAVR